MRIPLLLGAAALALAPAASAQWINEIHYDNTGGDVGEFVEIAIPSGDAIGDYSVELYNGSNGTVYGTIASDDFTMGATVNGITLYTAFPSSIQNGAPDGLALVKNGALVDGQFLSYEGVVVATGGTANDLSSTDIGVSEPGDTPIGQSLQLQGTGNEYADFAWAGPSAESPGAVNEGQVIVADEEPNEAPSASFTFSADGLTVDFTDTSSDSDGSVVSWAWSFGDGGTSTEQNPTRSYWGAGTYTVTLTVTDDDGASDSASQDVMVMADPGPGADVTGSLARGTCGATVPSSTSRCFLQATGTNNSDEAQRYTIFVVLEGPGEFSRIAKRGEIKIGAGGTSSNKLSLRTKSSDPDGQYDAVLLAEMGRVSSPSSAAVELDRLSFQKGGAGLRAEQALAAFPNPAADVATLSFSVAEAGEATLVVYDALGREVARLVDGAVEGLVEVSVDASALPAGLYVARLVVEGRVETSRFSVVR